MSVIRSDFHASLITRFIEDIFYQRSNLYYYLGKIEPWGINDEPVGELINSFEQDSIIRDNILYMRRVGSNEVSLVAAKYTWESDTVFEQWDHTKEMQGKNFYCITDEFNVYKCLDNNLGSKSTVKPISLSLFPFRTEDGYLWKYMYTVPPFKQSKFNSHGYMPVQRALTDSFYNKGAVEKVVVADGGSGYTDIALTNIYVGETEVGSGATAYVSAVNSLGQITGITISTPGSGYTAGAAVFVTSDTGTNAKISAVITDGVVTDFTIEDGGFNYSIGNAVNVTVGGAILLPVVSHITGEILDVKIINPGAGYATTPELTILQSPATGVGKYGNPGAIIKAIIYEGSIQRIVIEDPGVNYPFDTATTIVVSGDGEGASFSPAVYGGSIVDVIVEDTGVGYTYIQLDVVGVGSGAKLNAILAASDFLSGQSVIEQTAVRGAIYNAVVTEGGNNYSSQTMIQITGDGTGAEGYPVIENGSIVNIVMSKFGQNYSYANIKIVDPNRPDLENFVNAEAYAILPPYMGHGFDAPRELYADTISIYTLLRGDYELNLLQQDYRQYGLIINPTSLLTNKIITLDTTFVIFKVSLTTVSALNPDDILISNNKRYRIVSISGLDVELQQLNSFYSQPAGSFYKEGTPNVLYPMTKVLSVPIANKYSGNLLYVTNTSPFTPTDTQSVAIRTNIKL